MYELEQKTFSSMGETLQAFSPVYQEEMRRWLRTNNAPNIWFPLNFVRASEPEPFNLAQAVEMGPYAARSIQKERYDALAEDGCLEALDESTYRLTDRGRQIVEGFFRIAHEGLAGVEALPAAEMELLAGLLRRIIMATLESAEPAAKPSLMASRWTDPGPGASPAALIDQYVTDLVRYRDDAHPAAWRPTGVDGKTWETLTLLWQGDATTAAEVSDRLSNRGHTQEAYAASLNTLLEKEWVAQDGQQFTITEKGKQVRQEAEVETDRLFYAGWADLNQTELEQLDDLLARLNKELWRGALKLCWSQTSGVARAITPVTRTAVNDVFGEHFESPHTFFPTLMAYGNRPNSLSVAAYTTRFPYTKPDRAGVLLADALAGGQLVADGDSFVISEKGCEAIERVNDVFYTYLEQIDPLSEEESGELATFLGQIAEACLAADEPSQKWALTNIHGCHPEKKYGPLARIDQAIDDLNGFRDDSHIASWRDHEISGRDWDALTLLWRGEASTADELAEELQAKGYTAVEYGRSLSELSARGWLQATGEGYQVTDLGRQIRQEAELTTDALFFAPWKELANGEILRLHTLLVQMKHGLQQLAEDKS